MFVTTAIKPPEPTQPYFSGLYALTVEPLAPNLIAFCRVSSNFERK
jgi:hypothetical protein